MKNYLILDQSPPASRALRLALMESPGSITVNQTNDRNEIKQQLATGEITAVFVRIELWDHRLFEEVLSLGKMPELVLLGSAGQEPAACCGVGMPHFLADDASKENLTRILKHINSPFMQLMDFRFVLAKDGDKVYKIDLNQIQKVEAVQNGSLIHTTC